MNHGFKITKNLLKKPFLMFVDFLLPPRCYVSGDIVAENGMLSPKIWSGLDFIADPSCMQCGLPFEFKVEEKTICGNCLRDEPAYDMSRAALVYNEASKKPILAFKYSDKTYASVGFAHLMTQRGRDLIDASDFIVPVPLHPKRLWSRRYNQAALLAKEIGKRTQKTSVLDLLERVRHTPVQGKMDKKARKKNVSKAFVVREKYRSLVAGKTVLLIDDVFTTGSTLDACARTLKEAGASRVFTLCLARVYKS